MTILASAIIASLRITLLDPSPGDTWTDAILLAYLNEGERNVVMLKPEAYPVRAALAMVAGTKQTVPAGGIAILDLYDNVSGGRRVRQVNRSMLDDLARFWPTATQEATVQEWCADPRDPTRFDVIPPSTGTGSVNGLYGAVPTPIATVGTAINLLDIYELTLKHFVLSEAYAANTKRQDLLKTDYYRKSFERMLGVRSQSQVAVAPRTSAPGGDG